MGQRELAHLVSIDVPTVGARSDYRLFFLWRSRLRRFLSLCFVIFLFRFLTTLPIAPISLPLHSPAPRSATRGAYPHGSASICFRADGC